MHGRSFASGIQKMKQIPWFARLNKLQACRSSRTNFGEDNTMNGSLRHVAVALLTAASLIVSPAFAQAQQAQNQSPAQQQQGQTGQGQQPASQPGAQTGSSASEPVRNLREGMGAGYSPGNPEVPQFFFPFPPPH